MLVMDCLEDRDYSGTGASGAGSLCRGEVKGTFVSTEGIGTDLFDLGERCSYGSSFFENLLEMVRLGGDGSLSRLS